MCPCQSKKRKKKKKPTLLLSLSLLSLSPFSLPPAVEGEAAFSVSSSPAQSHEPSLPSAAETKELRSSLLFSAAGTAAAGRDLQKRSFFAKFLDRLSSCHRSSMSTLVPPLLAVGLSLVLLPASDQWERNHTRGSISRAIPERRASEREKDERRDIPLRKFEKNSLAPRDLGVSSFFFLCSPSSAPPSLSLPLPLRPLSLSPPPPNARDRAN